jgi:zinc protease
MLAKGAADLTATQIAQRFENVGAEFSNSIDRDMGWLKLRSLSQPKWLDPAIDTLALLLSKPAFNQKDFEREKKRYLSSLQREKQDPGSIASRALYKAVYGNHPYAGMATGTEETINAIKPTDMRKFFKQYYVAKNATVALVGDLDRKAAEVLVNRVLKQIAQGEEAEPLPPVKALSESKVIRIEHPSSQSHILMGHPGTYRGDPDYFRLYVGNHALGGGGLVSRLSDEIREKRGFSYSVYSYFMPLARKGMFQIGLQTKNSQVDEAIKVVRKTVTDYAKNGMTGKELSDSRKNITGGFPLRIDSNKKILGYLAMIGFYNMPLTYLDDFNKRIDELKLGSINKALAQHINTDKMVTVIVGQQ